MRGVRGPGREPILLVLRAAGREVDCACSEGACGTCVADVPAVRSPIATPSRRIETRRTD
ncbi:2Fe-2S iron-sulfur cluster-binding protein [Streptomyces sp. NPDC101234]|uniref:2Fe-2S iron-sulfur cluster-binding protein n=1 Tax=Streptomyces sp. NPDC101234 TaxID=3366138 RepID=UPI00380A2EF3